MPGGLAIPAFIMIFSQICLQIFLLGNASQSTTTLAADRINWILDVPCWLLDVQKAARDTHFCKSAIVNQGLMQPILDAVEIRIAVPSAAPALSNARSAPSTGRRRDWIDPF